MNTIEWTRKAVKQLKSIQKQQAVKIYDAVSTLENMPNCINVKKLTNFKYDYRLRVGNYRVFFDFSQTIKVVAIQEVKKRDERTY